MKNYENFKTLLQDLKNNIKIVDGLILENAEKYIISRKVNGIWELIMLSQYKNSEDLILVETNDFAFTVSRWDYLFSISQQITKNCK
tara:strand:+ start:274 stop:534 length:261 start_codon:yes stop_codon:yes gene_type:complete